MNDGRRPLEGKKVLVTGGTGSLGKVLIRRLLTGEIGSPERITVFSRDEAKQHQMRLDYKRLSVATDEVAFREAADVLDFRIGDVRDPRSVAGVLRDMDVVFNAAALKQVPTCEYFPFEAVSTNIIGPQNIVQTIREQQLPVELVVSISTDKACKPVNVMGMTKAIQERIFMSACLDITSTRFVCVRYGNVIASRGSVIPLFKEQVRRGGPVTVTTESMTRFLLALDTAVDCVFSAVMEAQTGETWVPRVPAARILDIARAMVGERQIDIVVTGIRPGEKIHEILVSEEERWRTVANGDYYVILPMLPELRSRECGEPCLQQEYSSGDATLSPAEIRTLLEEQGLIAAQ